MKNINRYLVIPLFAITFFMVLDLVPVSRNFPILGSVMAQSGTACNNNAGVGKPVLFWATSQLFGCPADTNNWTVLANSSGPVSVYGASGPTAGTGGQIVSQPKIWAGNIALGSVGSTGTVTFASGNTPTSATSYWVSAGDTSSTSALRVCCIAASSFGVVGATGSSGDVVHYIAVGN